jgi:hypothetical protein
MARLLIQSRDSLSRDRDSLYQGFLPSILPGKIEVASTKSQGGFPILGNSSQGRKLLSTYFYFPFGNLKIPRLENRKKQGTRNRKKQGTI